jgi:iron complex transport system ATP-binding protein
MDVRALSRESRARFLGLIPQVHEPVFSYTVGEVVLMGRAPHLGLVSSPGREDLRIAARALEAVGLGRLWDRPYTTLSGGEQRLCLIARGLAQGAAFLLMDEPDAHLDPRHQHEVLGMVQGLAREGLSFLVTTHNPNNALCANQVLLLGFGELIAEGSPGEALTPVALSRAYGIPFEVIGDGQGPRAVLPLRGSGA